MSLTKRLSRVFNNREKKVRAATDGTPSGPSYSELSDIAALTFDTTTFPDVTTVLDRRLLNAMEHPTKFWQQTTKALKLFKHLLLDGSPEFLRWAQMYHALIRDLKQFRCSERGRDFGLQVRELATTITDVLENMDQLREERSERGFLNDNHEHSRLRSGSLAPYPPELSTVSNTHEADDDMLPSYAPRREPSRQELPSEMVLAELPEETAPAPPYEREEGEDIEHDRAYMEAVRRSLLDTVASRQQDPSMSDLPSPRADESFVSPLTPGIRLGQAESSRASFVSPITPETRLPSSINHEGSYDRARGTPEPVAQRRRFSFEDHDDEVPHEEPFQKFDGQSLGKLHPVDMAHTQDDAQSYHTASDGEQREPPRISIRSDDKDDEDALLYVPDSQRIAPRPRFQSTLDDRSPIPSRRSSSPAPSNWSRASSARVDNDELGSTRKDILRLGRIAVDKALELRKRSGSTGDPALSSSQTLQSLKYPTSGPSQRKSRTTSPIPHNFLPQIPSFDALRLDGATPPLGQGPDFENWLGDTIKALDVNPDALLANTSIDVARSQTEKAPAVTQEQIQLPIRGFTSPWRRERPTSDGSYTYASRIARHETGSTNPNWTHREPTPSLDSSLYSPTTFSQPSTPLYLDGETQIKIVDRPGSPDSADYRVQPYGNISGSSGIDTVILAEFESSAQLSARNRSTAKRNDVSPLHLDNRYHLQPRRMKSDLVEQHRLRTEVHIHCSKHPQSHKCTTHTKEETVVTPHSRRPTSQSKSYHWVRRHCIGRGRFGTVWLETEEGVEGNRTRAVKDVFKESGVDYNRELFALANLSQRSHDLFVDFHGWFADERHIYLAMEYFEDGDLKQYIYQNENISEADAKSIVRQVLEGLKFMHSPGLNLCHRDLKPQNVFMCSTIPGDVWVKIGDFGLSKQESEDTLLLSEVGTPCYAPPEILFPTERFEPSSPIATRSPYTNAVDIWAVGMLTHEVLTKKILFNRRALLDYEAGRLQFPTRALDELGAVGWKAMSFIQRLLAPRDRDRPSAEQCLDDSWLRT